MGVVDVWNFHSNEASRRSPREIYPIALQKFRMCAIWHIFEIILCLCTVAFKPIHTKHVYSFKSRMYCSRYVWIHLVFVYRFDEVHYLIIVYCDRMMIPSERERSDNTHIWWFSWFVPWSYINVVFLLSYACYGLCFAICLHFDQGQGMWRAIFGKHNLFPLFNQITTPCRSMIYYSKYPLIKKQIRPE